MNVLGIQLLQTHQVLLVKLHFGDADTKARIWIYKHNRYEMRFQMLSQECGLSYHEAGALLPSFPV